MMMMMMMPSISPPFTHGPTRGAVCACAPMAMAASAAAVRLPFPLDEGWQDCRCYCCYCCHHRCPDRTEHTQSQLTLNGIKLGTKTAQSGKLECLLFACGRPQNIQILPLSDMDGRKIRSQTNLVMLEVKRILLTLNNIQLLMFMLFDFKQHKIVGSLGVGSPVFLGCWRACKQTTNIQTFVLGTMLSPRRRRGREALCVSYLRMPLPCLSGACLYAGRPRGQKR